MSSPHKTSFGPADKHPAETVRALPVEVLEMLLIKTAVMLLKRLLNTLPLRPRDEVIATALATLNSVCYEWWYIITSREWNRRQLRHGFSHEFRPYARHPQVQSTLQTEDGVLGITKLNDLIYIVCVKSDVIRVFSSHYERLEDIYLEGLVDARDITVCSESAVLYVAIKNCVWQVNEKHEVNEFISYVDSPCSLSVRSRRLLVTSYDHNELRLFDVDGKHLKQILLPDDLKPLYAVETDNNTFVVCHWGRQHGVCEVDVDGHVIRVCNERLYGPHHLALDVDGRVFVADCWNHRVLLLNRQLQLERVVLDNEHNELNWPRRLYYVPETGCLLVGDGNKPGRVKVYSLMD